MNLECSEFEMSRNKELIPHNNNIQDRCSKILYFEQIYSFNSRGYSRSTIDFEKYFEMIFYFETF